MSAQTLGGEVRTRDAASFVGRREELGQLERLIRDERGPRVIFVHGPGGIGKSALLRELARRAERRGSVAHWVEGREISPSPDALEDAFAGARGGSRPLVILDSFERIAGVGGYLRRVLLPALPEGARVVVAGRRPPDDAWFQGGWEAVSAVYELAPLRDDDARAIARACGIREASRAAALAAWAGGSPLALTLAASLAQLDRGWRPETALDRAELVDTVIRRLVGAELEGPRWTTLAVAAIARCVTLSLLREVLPESVPETEYEWLRARSFAEPLGEGLALHHLVRRALYADLRRRDPRRERELRRRVADHLYARAAAGDLLLAIDLAHLIESPAIRWGYSWEASERYHLDEVRGGDADAFEAALAGTRHERLWRGSREFFERAPEHVSVVRDRAGGPCGYTVVAAPATASSLCDADPVLGPRLEHARGLGASESAVAWRDMVDLTRDRTLHVIGMLGLAGTLHAPLANPRYAYLIIDPALPGALDFGAALGARHLADLDVELDFVRLECHLVDNGPGGMLAHEREVIYRELGLPAPVRQEKDGPAAIDQVREALRNFHEPELLADSPLARGSGVDRRAADVRELVLEAAERAFGEGPNEQLFKRALIRGYLDPAPSHEAAADELALSRSAYFRRLKLATERVASHLAKTRRV
jgi:hypothetical protein